MDAGARFHISTGTSIEGRYTIIRPIGSGGWADVYEAVQHGIEREVAIKILNVTSLEKLGDLSVFEQRFLQEANAMSRIDHPSCIRVFDTGFLGTERLPYMAMELLEGHDLEEELEVRGRLAPARLIPLFLEVLEALEIAHHAGVIHRDLKPSNLFLHHPGSELERLKILDFGIARIHSDPKLTSQGEILGTPRYLAPEWIICQQVTPAMDVYQMGLCLVELLTGRPVIDSLNPFECMNMHTTGNLSIPEALLAGPLGPVLEKALHLDPGERFPDAGAFHEALASIDPEGIEVPQLPVLKRIAAQPSSPTTILPEPEARRGPHPLFVVFISALVCLLVVLILWAFGAKDGNDPASSNERAAEAELETSPMDGARETPEEMPAPSVEPPSMESPAPKETEVAKVPEPAQVSLASKPEGAWIVRDGERLGKTPTTLSFAEDEEVTLLFRKRGYTTLTVAFTARPELQVQRSLRPTDGGEKRAKRKKRKTNRKTTSPNGAPSFAP